MQGKSKDVAWRNIKFKCHYKDRISLCDFPIWLKVFFNINQLEVIILPSKPPSAYSGGFSIEVFSATEYPQKLCTKIYKWTGTVSLHSELFFVLQS